MEINDMSKTTMTINDLNNEISINYIELKNKIIYLMITTVEGSILKNTNNTPSNANGVQYRPIDQH